MASSHLPFPFRLTTTSYRAGAIFKFEMCQSAPRHLVFPLKLLDLINQRYAQNANIYEVNHDLEFYLLNTISSMPRGKPSQWRNEGGCWGCSTPPLRNSEGRQKSCQTQPELWKLL